MSYVFAAFGNGQQFFGGATSASNPQLPLAGGSLYTYSGGTTSAVNTWTSSSGSTLNPNPIVLGADGRVPNEIWLTAGTTVKYVLQDTVGNTIATWDNIPGVNDGTTVISSSGGSTGTTQNNVFTATSGQTAFSLSFSYPVGVKALQVFQNGVKLESGTDFTETSGSSFTLTVGALTGDTISANLFGLNSVLTNSTRTITSASYSTNTTIQNTSGFYQNIGLTGTTSGWGYAYSRDNVTYFTINSSCPTNFSTNTMLAPNDYLRITTSVSVTVTIIPI